MNIKSIEITWEEFCKMKVEDDWKQRECLRAEGVAYKYKSGTQWVCWTKLEGEEFLPNCKGKLKWGKNV